MTTQIDPFARLCSFLDFMDLQSGKQCGDYIADDKNENTMQKGHGTHMSHAVEGHESETMLKVACY